MAACDAAAIGLAPPESATVDPQQRLLLEAAASALTCASDGASTTTASVFVGIQQMEYGGLASKARSPLTAYTATSAAFSVAAGRLAYTYSLTGEAVAVDTACSSALVAVHLGAARARATARATATGCSLAAGVNLALADTTSAAATLAGMLCGDGR